MYGRRGDSSRRMPAYAPMTATIAIAASAATAIHPLSVMTPAPCACDSQPGHCHQPWQVTSSRTVSGTSNIVGARRV